MEILNYDDNKHRSQVVNIWKSVFNYKDSRNDPEFLIDCKLSVNDNLFFVAVSQNQVVGTIMAGYDGHRGWIYSLAVIAENRNEHIGTKLLVHAENELKKLGCPKIKLQILKSNETVKEFYLKNNYQIEELICMGKEIKENIKTKRKQNKTN
ncbi:MAG TPA: GNAT family acetyltransferase [Chitinispirillaceae bacterium]|nr:GNAT family acetyltransferase [Chitinispirillaceae bacterium]